MKKVYLMAVAALFGSASMAQVSVTFQVDMNGETVSANGVHAAGNWQDGMPGQEEGDWVAGANMMTDGDSDGIYELEVDLPLGEYEFKFINGNNWDPDGTNLGNEGVPDISRKGGGNNNRVFVVSQWHADNGGLVLPANTYDGSAPAGQVAVRFEVDVSDVETIDPSGVHVVGDFSSPQFTPAASKMWLMSDSKYGFLAYTDENTSVAYKFTTDDSYDGIEWNGVNPPLECTDGLDRIADVTTEDVNTGLVCFEQCGPCTQPSTVTLTVDMSNVSSLAAEIYAAGTFNGYSDQAMSDNGDGTFSLVLELAPDDYLFKFKNGSDVWEEVPPSCQGEGSADRPFTVVEGENLTVASCFQQCTEECVADPDAAEITFQVDMSAETVAAEGVFIIGGFTDPTWQGGANQMSDIGDGVYEATLLVSGPADISYKFVNGDVNVVSNEEFQGNTEQLACNVPSGQLNGWNRTHTRSGVPEALGFVYNSCESILSTTDLELGRVAIYPNPSEGVSFLELENPNNHTLRMNIVDITGKVVTGNMLINTTRYEINTTNLNSGLYFLNIVNERSERAVYKLMVQ
jgi:hypothetical protein